MHYVYLRNKLKLQIMKKLDKKLILAACIDKQNELIESFSNRIGGMEDDVMDRNHSASQSDNRSPERIELMNAIGLELDFAKREMEFLKNLDVSKEYEIIEPGAVVETEKMTFYICVSIEEFEVGGSKLFGISTKAPLYLEMNGLKTGDTFSFNKQTYTIKDVY